MEDDPVAIDPGRDAGEEERLRRVRPCERGRAVSVLRPRSIQRPQMGRKRTRVELERKIKSPENAEDDPAECGVRAGACLGIGRGSPMPRMRRAMTSAQAKRQAVTDISQIQWTAYWHGGGIERPEPAGPEGYAAGGGAGGRSRSSGWRSRRRRGRRRAEKMLLTTRMAQAESGV